MDRRELKRALRDMLLRTGFYVSDETALRSISFDVISRRDNMLLIIKVLTNINSFSKPNSHNMKVLATVLGAAPLIVGEHNGYGSLEDGVVYLRHGIPIISIETMADYLYEGVPPYIYSAPGGYYVKIDSDRLHELRVQYGISLGMLADALGVSRKAVQMYEDGMSTMVDIALSMEEYFGEPLIRPVDPFTYDSELHQIAEHVQPLEGHESEVFGHLKALGYEVVPTQKCPFDALTHDTEACIITGVGRHSPALRKRAYVLTNISKITEKYSAIFIDKRENDNIQGTPLISARELATMEEPKEVLELIFKRL